MDTRDHAMAIVLVVPDVEPDEQVDVLERTQCGFLDVAPAVHCLDQAVEIDPAGHRVAVCPRT
jgi:hypothetical protein